jgi:hypothetical protein
MVVLVRPGKCTKVGQTSNWRELQLNRGTFVFDFIQTDSKDDRSGRSRVASPEQLFFYHHASCESLHSFMVVDPA